MNVTPSDPLHQEYLTINLLSTLGDGGTDAGQEEQPGAENAGGGAVCCQLTFHTATSQDGSSLEFIAPIAGRQCYI